MMPLVSNVLDAAKEPIQSAMATVAKLSESASKLPYYKYNQMWNRQIQDLVYSLLFWGWLGGYQQQGSEIKNGRLLTIEELGELLKVPVNLKDEDAFHLTIEEYLHALISLVEELVRSPPHLRRRLDFVRLLMRIIVTSCTQLCHTR